MRFVGVVLSCALTVAVACGGSIAGDSGTDCSSSSCVNGSSCTTEIACNSQKQTQTCTCKNGAWACPAITCTPPPPPCSDGVTPGSACSVRGAMCWSNETLLCTDIPPPCTCDGSKWQCNRIACPACPAPSEVKHGEKCLQTRFNCDGTIDCGTPVATKCNCFAGTWQCAPVPDCKDGG